MAEIGITTPKAIKQAVDAADDPLSRLGMMK
eukprot:CAMPEP_0204633270 /NCGR_PEP_ID=MMETSP0717-20131115/26793_1 /ASSEMBLY_ACC=CAM_ASM_000666 /TAXON_ID=230516 /ORGANISM="Chaetoceros curvisetus" /LENGTH=30 /DNA_ID= /DNA_START= /DNA_END= /DNA_ORIENTATION=